MFREKVYCRQIMKQPVYILENGDNVPYVPINVKTHRDAYAASLHVLFKHVADFHVCIVQAFSKKYGIPEDDILKTIHESDEFKNMYVDPVLALDHVLDPYSDSLGYFKPSELVPTQAPVTSVTESLINASSNLEAEITPKIAESISEPTVAKKRVIKKKQTDNIMSSAIPTETPASGPISAPVPEKKRVIKKKQADTAPAPALEPETRPDTAPAQTVAIVTEKKKIIKKTKVQAEPEPERSDIPKQPCIEPIQSIAITPNISIAQLLATTPTPEEPIQKKIIRKREISKI